MKFNLLSLSFLAGLLAVGPFFTPSAQAEVRYTAQIFELEGSKALLFNYKSEGRTEGDVYYVTNTFTALDGQVATVEEITFNKDGSAKLYTVDQKQLGAKGRVSIENGKATFAYTKKDGKEKQSSESAGADFIITTAIPMDLATNWDKIMKGDKLKRRLAVVDRMETVGFEFSKEKEVDLEGKKAVVVRMKPSSFIIAAIVKPLHFYMSADGKQLYEIQGRTTVKRLVGSEYKDLDARAVYTKGAN